MRDDWAWWRERVRRAEGTIADLQPMADNPAVVDLWIATATAVRLIRLVTDRDIGIVAGRWPRLEVSPAALRRLLTAVLLETVKASRTAGTPGAIVVGANSDSNALDVIYSADAQEAERVERLTRDRIQRLADELGWHVTRNTEYVPITISLHWPRDDVFRSPLGKSAVVERWWN